MTRYIKNISEIDYEFVISDAWDIVEFDLTLNENKIAEYLQTIITDFNNYTIIGKLDSNLDLVVYDAKQ